MANLTNMPSYFLPVLIQNFRKIFPLKPFFPEKIFKFLCMFRACTPGQTAAGRQLPRHRDHASRPSGLLACLFQSNGIGCCVECNNQCRFFFSPILSFISAAAAPIFLLGFSRPPPSSLSSSDRRSPEASPRTFLRCLKDP